jgi:glucose/arabinose dehydrogenase
LPVVSRRTIAAVAFVAAALVVGAAVWVRQAAVDDPGPDASRVASDRPCPDEPSPPAPPLTGDDVPRLVRLGHADEPTSAAFLEPSGDGVLGERSGRVLRVERGTLTDEVVLDLRADTMDEGDGGLLSLAYSPDGDWLYVYRANAERDDTLTSYPVDDDGRPSLEGGREILQVDHPDSLQHHGGGLVVSGDGLLYLGLGDGGGLGDPRENAQDPSTHLGKLLRIEPTPEASRPYRVPDDNPFVDRPGWEPEIWVVGVRNPFRLTLDEKTGDLWLGDVGQSCWEEIDHLTPDAGGSNLGWDIKEGTYPFEGGTVPDPEVEPVMEHPHRDGWCGIVTGVVVRDPDLPGLDGRLLYTDYCKGRLYALAVDPAGGAEPPVVDVGIAVENPSAIVRGPGASTWLLTLQGDVFELVGAET